MSKNGGSAAGQKGANGPYPVLIECGSEDNTKWDCGRRGFGPVLPSPDLAGPQGSQVRWMQVGVGSLPSLLICLAHVPEIDAGCGQTHSNARARTVHEFAPILHQRALQSFMRQWTGSIRHIKWRLLTVLPPAGGVLPAGFIHRN
jgi:hypothetical protein